jgi:hypothetical protein
MRHLAPHRGAMIAAATLVPGDRRARRRCRCARAAAVRIGA